MLEKEFFKDDAVKIAKKLLGKVIEYNDCKAMIVETEAYKDDKASHGHKITKRSEIMLSSYGKIYIYFIYGMYFCLNFTTNKDTVGAVLIRAVEPLEGKEIMKKRRKTQSIHNLTSGPGKLCQALGITKNLNNTNINEKIKVYDYKTCTTKEIGTSPRIGISKAKDLHWRFYIKNNPFVSKYA